MEESLHLSGTTFAEVIVPLSLPGTFTYSIPSEYVASVIPGIRVAVQFGRNRIYAAMVIRVHDEAPLTYAIKPVLYPIDEFPVIHPVQLNLWEWIARYYMASPGEVLQAALPSVLKLSSETLVLVNPDFDGDMSQLSEKEVALLYALGSNKELSLSDVSRITGLKKVIPLVKTLIDKKVISIVEEVRERQKPRTESLITLAEPYTDESELQKLFSRLEKKAPRQLELLMAWISVSRQDNTMRVKRSKLKEAANGEDTILSAMIKKGIFVREEEIVSRFPVVPKQEEADSIVFTEVQENAYMQILESFKERDIVLLNGVTSSGKTELYIRLIQETIREGKQVLYLLPEIALTTQMMVRLKRYFGDDVGIYHSRYHEQERVEVWNRVLGWSAGGEAVHALPIVLGARSALFLPFQNLGLIIVDEEHDSSYKQQDPAPRYHARDAAIILAGFFKARVLLGSATPSVESSFNALSGKYGLVELKERYGGLRMPEIQVVDIVEELKKRTMKSVFTSVLLRNIEETIAQGEQVILFQNRRGYSLRIECDACHWIPECKHCDVTLTYHKIRNEISCHYCGYSIKIPVRCPQCGSAHLKMKGYGTERIEEDLTDFIPGIRVSRMDFDTTRGKLGVERIISAFEDKKIDVLVGTQMVTKGLDFNNVGLVGIINADNMLNFPDFRAFERSFQLMAQVSGRAGRKSTRGKVIIQTYTPEHTVIRQVINNDYSEMLQTQLYERRQFKYPPYYRMIELTLKHKDAALLGKAARHLAEILRKRFEGIVLGPEYPLVSRINNLYLKRILLKLEKNQSLTVNKDVIAQCLKEYELHVDYRSVRIAIDVDPFS